jgi:hypothetical protein
VMRSVASFGKLPPRHRFYSVQSTQSSYGGVQLCLITLHDKAIVRFVCNSCARHLASHRGYSPMGRSISGPFRMVQNRQKWLFNFFIRKYHCLIGGAQPFHTSAIFVQASRWISRRTTTEVSSTKVWYRFYLSCFWRLSWKPRETPWLRLLFFLPGKSFLSFHELEELYCLFGCGETRWVIGLSENVVLNDRGHSAGASNSKSFWYIDDNRPLFEDDSSSF